MDAMQINEHHPKWPLTYTSWYSTFTLTGGMFWRKAGDISSLNILVNGILTWCWETASLCESERHIWGRSCFSPDTWWGSCDKLENKRESQYQTIEQANWLNLVRVTDTIICKHINTPYFTKAIHFMKIYSLVLIRRYLEKCGAQVKYSKYQKIYQWRLGGYFFGRVAARIFVWLTFRHRASSI